MSPDNIREPPSTDGYIHSCPGISKEPRPSKTPFVVDRMYLRFAPPINLEYGGAFVVTDSSHVLWSSEGKSEFDGNQAGTAGGALTVLLGSQASCTVGTTTTFSGNSTIDGGAFWVFRSCVFLQRQRRNRRSTIRLRHQVWWWCGLPEKRHCCI